VAVQLLRVPTSAGAYNVGQERAPEALERAGLLDALRTAGVVFEDAGAFPVEMFRPDPSNRREQNLPRVVDVASRVADGVATIAEGGDIPLLLGGDCTITVGVVAGLVTRWPELGLAYLDGDADLDTPQTTQSGILDAMGIAHLLAVDGAAQALAGVGPRTPLLSGDRVALVGYEESDLDDARRALLDAHGVHRVPASAVRGRPAAAAAEALSALGDSAPVVVHFDVDVIDSIDSPLGHFPHFNAGLSFDDAMEALAGLCAARRVAAITVTEVNPDHDRDGKHLRRLAQGLAAAVRNLRIGQRQGDRVS
jgi:arginase